MLHIKRYFGALLVILFLAQATAVSASAEPLDEIRALIQNYYIEDVPASVLSKTTAEEITSQLDPYSVYMSADEYTRFSNSIEQQLVGIGIVLEEDPKGVKILSVIKGGPADRAGVKAGDVIVSANGNSLEGQSVQKAISIITGKVNTKITLQYIESESKKAVTVTLTRELIKLPNVEYQMLGGKIGYIRLNSFSQTAAKEISDAIGQFSNVNGWIFDLRNNGGGYVSSAQEVAGLFPNVENAFQLRYKNAPSEVYAAIPQKVPFKKPVHLLINEYSASASEMVAGTLQENKGAVLYGQNSFGKGSMQSLFPLSDKSVLKLTTARFYTPKGTPIHEIGVKPDHVTAKGEEIIASHRDHIIGGLSNYKKLPALENVPVTKTFTVTMNTKMDWTKVKPQDVQLIQLGGEEKAVDIKILDPYKISVKPKEELESKGRYMLLIHPHWKSAKAAQMEKGSFVEISVK